MFCKHCGNEVLDSAVVCPKCGSSLKQVQETTEEDKAGAGWIILSILIPLVGAILGIVWMQNPQTKKKGKTMLITAAISFGVYVLFWGCVGAGAAALEDEYYYGMLLNTHPAFC